MSTATRSATAQRFAARGRRRRLRTVGFAFVAVLLVLLAGGGVYLVGWSSVLSVQDVRVEGVDGGLAEEVEQVAEVPMNVPLVRVDTDEVAERVRELPDVGEVDVHRSWPRSITVEVEPRVPVAAVPDGSRWWSVDESGVLFGRSDTAAEGVPVLAAPVGESAQLDRAMGVSVLTGLPPSIEDLVASVEVESAADVRLILEDDTVVLWGTDERADDKARVLLALIAEYEEPSDDGESGDDDDGAEDPAAVDGPPSAYDVSAPDNPAIVP